MSWIIPLLALPLSAAPAPLAGASTVETTALAEARAEAAYLVRIADDVARSYVRPVERKGLLKAALMGMYEEARLPVPESLDDDIAQATDDVTTMALVVRVRESLSEVESLRAGNALRAGVRAMCRGLDSYCGLISGDDLRRGQGEDLNYGLGFTYELTGDGAAPLRVKTVVIGGPAQRAGMRPGDGITHLDGRKLDDTSGLLLTFPALLQRAEDPRSIEVTFRRGDESKERTATLTSEQFRPETVLGVRRERGGDWNYWLDAERKIAHVRVGALDQGVAEDLGAILARLREDGMRGLILDLRWSPGGFLNQAIWVSRLFLPEGAVVVRTRARNKITGDWDEQDYPCTYGGAFGNLPLVVLVNGETSGGAELIAAALQDHKRATIVGQRTFGKASIQTQEPLPMANAGLKVTSGNFLRPSGKALHRFADSRPSDDWGVRPLPEHETVVSTDFSIHMRDEWLKLSQRPGGDDEALLLDDPDNDPQRNAAARILLGKLK